LEKIRLFAKIKLMEEKELQKSLHHIHDSAVLLGARVVFAFLAVELIYYIFIYFLFFTEIGSSIQYQRSYIILGSSLIKFILQIYYVVYVVLAWVKNNFYITEDKLVHCRGILTVDEEIYDISGIKSVKSHQSLVGRVFNYGNVVVEVSASGGYHKEILLRGIVNPKKYERILNEYLEKHKKH